jgi:pyridoxal phosphate enzyme (YggS family)
MTVTERLATIRTGISEECLRLNRSAEEVSLIAVSKRHPASSIQVAHNDGQLHFGENFAQELRDKSKELPLIEHWHFIGRIQKNKAKYIAPSAYRVHSLESVEQANALASRAPRPLHCLVGVNIGREEQKSGVLPKDLLERVKALSQVNNIQLTGLMCLPPFHENPKDTAPYFEEMQSLLSELNHSGFNLNELSMGMSQDYRIALRYGATWLRIGTAIFGPRPG